MDGWLYDMGGQTTTMVVMDGVLDTLRIILNNPSNVRSRGHDSLDLTCFR